MNLRVSTLAKQHLKLKGTSRGAEMYKFQLYGTFSEELYVAE